MTMLQRCSWSALAAMIGVCSTFAQGPPQSPFLSAQPPAHPGFHALAMPVLPPLLYVRLGGPPGMKVTFFRGQAGSATFDVPCTVGLRPGYSYRIQLSGLPGAQLYSPTLDVLGSLMLPDNLRTADFPIALNFTKEDFYTVQSAGLVTKVGVLEHPEIAIPQASSADQPHEIMVPANGDVWREGFERGRPVLLVRMGQRQLVTEELAQQGIPGTILFPGEKALGMPALAPWVPFQCHAVQDPVAGPRPTIPETALFDGGDIGAKAGLSGNRIKGVDPSDTVAVYADSKGRRQVVCSNRVGLCVPRYVIVRGETVIAGQHARYGPGGADTVHGQARLDSRQPVGEHQQNTHLEGMGARQKASGTTTTIGTTVVGRAEGLDLVAAVRTTESVNASQPPPLIPEPADGPLCIIKWPDRFGAMVGDVITFFVKYTNQGGQPITGVIVTDSLAPRFEYVPGSAKTDREAVFTMQPNDAGSQTLRWEIQGRVLPRDSGMVSFQVRVR